MCVVCVWQFFFSLGAKLYAQTSSCAKQWAQSPLLYAKLKDNGPRQVMSQIRLHKGLIQSTYLTNLLARGPWILTLVSSGWWLSSESCVCHKHPPLLTTNDKYWMTMYMLRASLMWHHSTQHRWRNWKDVKLMSNCIRV